MSPSSRTLLSTECRSLNHGDRYIRQGESGVLSLAPSHAHLLLWGPGVMPTTVPSMFLHTDSQGHMDPLNRSQKFQDSSCTLTVGDLGKSRKGRGYQGVNCREHDLEGSSIRSEHLHICISVSLAFFWALWLYRDSTSSHQASEPYLPCSHNFWGTHTPAMSEEGRS